MLVNAALNLPATQALLNGTQNGKIAIHWDRAWSLFPFRLHIAGLRVNGQSWSQQFDVSAPSVSGAIDVPSLFSQTLRFNDVSTGRPHRPLPAPAAPRQGRQPSSARSTPRSPGRDPKLAAEPVPTQSPGWLVGVRHRQHRRQQRPLVRSQPHDPGGRGLGPDRAPEPARAADHHRRQARPRPSPRFSVAGQGGVAGRHARRDLRRRQLPAAGEPGRQGAARSSRSTPTSTCRSPASISSTIFLKSASPT